MPVVELDRRDVALPHLDLVEESHVSESILGVKTAEQQIKDRCGSYYAGQAPDISGVQKSASSYHYWNHHPHDHGRGSKKRNENPRLPARHLWRIRRANMRSTKPLKPLSQ